LRLASEIYSSQEESYKKGLLETSVGLTAKLTAAWTVDQVLSRVGTGRSRDSLRYLREYQIEGTPWFAHPGVHRYTKTASVKEMIWNSIKASEEMLFKIPRSFSLSALYGRGIVGVGNVDFAADGKFLQDKNNINYLNKLTGGKLTPEVIARGLKYERSSSQLFGRGKLYGFDEAGNKILLLNKADLFPGYWGENLFASGKPQGFMPRFGRSLYGQHGIKMGRPDVFMSGGKNFFSAIKEEFGALSTVAVENYVKLLDDPFELLRKGIDNSIGRNIGNGRLFSRAYSMFKKAGLQNQFGVGGRQFMEGKGAAELLKRHSLRGLSKLAGITMAYKGVDSLLRMSGIPGFKSGIKGVAANLYQKLSSGITTASDITGMTWLTKKQEDKAPGSTSLVGLSSFAASAAIAGGTLGKLTDIIQRVPVGEKGPAPQFFSDFISSMQSKGGALGNIIKRSNASNFGRVGAYATMGAAIGAALVLPFIPGALGSNKSAEELDAIYSGKEKVAIRRGRFWEASSSSFQGEDIEFFAPHWTVRAMSDAGKRGRTPEEYYKNPIRGFLARMIDPYAYDKKLDEERPYTYWGPTDYGFGFVEKLFAPLKEAWKPTILAHPEALAGVHPSQMLRYGPNVPRSLDGKDAGTTTSGYLPDVTRPDALQTYASEAMQSLKDVFGLQGFVISSATDALTGGQSFLTPNSIYESSGRINSAQRAFWDASIGGGGSNTEAYRRLNPDREYSTEYISAPIRNKLPSWMEGTPYVFGDPFSQIKMGEYRMPGRGYQSLHPELEGVDPEEYPLVHRLSILGDVAPMSPNYYKYKGLVEEQIATGKLNQAGIDLYNESMRQREMVRNDDRFDYGDGAIGSYYLALKKAGRALPTESLYPFSPVHKFAGNVDPLTEYRDRYVLDKPFKLWQNPFSDFIKPAYNKTIDMFSLHPFMPKETKELYGINTYFDALQQSKNAILQEQADAAAQDGKLDEAAFYRSGIRKTLQGTSVLEAPEVLEGMLPQRDQRFLKQFIGAPASAREELLSSVSPEMGQILSGQWKADAMSLATDAEHMRNLRQSKIDTSQQMGFSSSMPDRDFIGYAAGVDLNAVKVKTVDHMGKNIRDFGLWREDERQAQILDGINNTRIFNSGDFDKINPPSPELSKKALEDYLKKIGMRGARIMAVPINGATSVSFVGSESRKNKFRDNMRERGEYSG